MYLQDQGIDYDNGSVGRVRRAHIISNDDGGVGRRQVIDSASKGLDTTTAAERIQGQQRRL